LTAKRKAVGLLLAGEPTTGELLFKLLVIPGEAKFWRPAKTIAICACCPANTPTGDVV